MPLTGSHTLKNDIDCAGVDFTPLGDPNTSGFSGSFDGRGHEIANLNITRPGGLDVGLFGFALNAQICCVGLVGATVVGDNNVGAVVALNIGSTLRNLWVRESEVRGLNDVGGVVGYQQSGVSSGFRVTNVRVFCAGLNGGGGVGTHDSGSVSDVIVSHTQVGENVANQLGGVVGTTFSDSVLSQVFVTHSYIAGRSDIGGVVGYSEGSLSLSAAEDCVIEGADVIGGCVGTHYGPQSILDAYSLGNLTSTQGSAAGFAGNVESNAAIRRSFSFFPFLNIDPALLNAGAFLGFRYQTTVSDCVFLNVSYLPAVGDGSVFGITGFQEIDFLNSNRFPVSWDRTNTWKIGGTHPKLRMRTHSAVAYAAEVVVSVTLGAISGAVLGDYIDIFSENISCSQIPGYFTSCPINITLRSVADESIVYPSWNSSACPQVSLDVRDLPFFSGDIQSISVFIRSFSQPNEWISAPQTCTNPPAQNPSFSGNVITLFVSFLNTQIVVATPTTPTTTRTRTATRTTSATPSATPTTSATPSGTPTASQTRTATHNTRTRTASQTESPATLETPTRTSRRTPTPTRSSRRTPPPTRTRARTRTRTRVQTPRPLSESPTASPTSATGNIGGGDGSAPLSDVGIAAVVLGCSVGVVATAGAPILVCQRRPRPHNQKLLLC
eukprot:TRINITY_DN6993_c0_g1_i1.p1 TRINITY_DN6993_c0_g1~~TRINITY_DN6993_c0_g1_i1.p1  ORF type:complete len:694 (+),score=141.50 TRINITY_DN6993_c0_g1_i1:85-2082(+)